MHYDNSLTSKVEYVIKSSLATKIQSAEKYWDMRETAEEFRKFLSNPITINTPDFIIRRYIQKYHKSIIPEGCEVPNLTESNNIPWDESVLKKIAKELKEPTEKQGAKITQKEWIRYLKGFGVKSRSKVFMIAFVLKMSKEDTMDLLLSFNMEPYSVRYPMDLICLFCQESGNSYTWSEAEAMMDEFMNQRNYQNGNPKDSKVGMTQQITNDLRKLFEMNLPDAEAKEALIEYMVKNSNEFKCVIKGKEEYFLPGYSLTKEKQFMRLVEYLAVLYPEFAVTDEKLLDIPKKVRYDEDDFPSMTDVVKAMFYNLGWSHVYWNDKSEENCELINEKNNIFDFEKSMQKFVTNYLQHIMKIERLKKGGKNVSFFERRDALLFIYFLIAGYNNLAKLTRDESKIIYHKLQELYKRESDIDIAIKETLEKVDYIYGVLTEEEDAAEKIDMLRTCFDQILATMDYMGLYLPAIYDRFFLLASISEVPDELLPLVFSQAEYE